MTFSPSYVVHTGYFCPTGTGVLSSINYCSSPTTYCPLGSANVSLTAVGYYAVAKPGQLYFNESLCEPGRYCIGGVAQSCTAGRYGVDWGSTNASCTGVCRAGYYCPAGSTSPTQQPCGSVTAYCPEVCPRLDRLLRYGSRCHGTNVWLSSVWLCVLCDVGNGFSTARIGRLVHRARKQ